MSSIAPGWYPDPDPSAPAGRQRWYSGEGWTQHVETPNAAPVVVDNPAPAYPTQQPSAGQVPQPWGPTPQGGSFSYPAQPGYGAPAVPSYGDAYGQPWNPAAQYGGQRVAVGTMSKQEFKALPRSVRKATDRPDIDLAIGKNRLATEALTFGIVSLVFNLFCIVSIVGIVRSSRALRRANQFGADGYPPLGYGQAVAGLVLCIISTALWPLAFWVQFHTA